MIASRYLAPAGAPLHAADLYQAARLTLSSRDVTGLLQDAFRQRFGVRHCFLTSTGRGGLTLLLRALRRLAPTDRDEVVLPAYTCFSVAASVVKAGLKPRIVDVSSLSLDYDDEGLGAAAFGRALAIVATNLYGLPNDMVRLKALASGHGIFLIDDAAQAMGASVDGRPSGTWGDAGLFSLDKGKNVTAIDGGVLVTSSDAIAEAVSHEMASIAAASREESVAGVGKALGYWLMLRPQLYWIPNGIPALGLGRTAFTTEFPVAHASRPLVALAISTIRRLDELTRGRVETAAKLLEGLRSISGIRPVMPRENSRPVYLRLPVLFDDAGARQQAWQALNQAGIGASGSYPAALADVPELRPFLADGDSPSGGGRWIAQRILTLPTHAFVRDADVRRIIGVLRELRPAAVAPASGLSRQTARIGS